MAFRIYKRIEKNKGNKMFQRLKNILKASLSEKNQRKLRRIFLNFVSLFAKNDLNKLGIIYGTDKVGHHFYTQHYMTHFSHLKNKKIRLLEIGVGGAENPDIGGHSLRMWKRYFPYSSIYGIDIFDKSSLCENRIKIYQGSQVDEQFLDEITKEIGELDVIIDDGSHLSEHIIKSFKLLFPKLKKGGIYVVEDVQTSYWDHWGGDSKNINNPETAMNFFKSLVDCLNYKEFTNPEYNPTYYDKNIVSIHFYHDIIFIYKNDNDEPSTILY
jgi:demethylmacrocin O-methyltransferase